ncbi:MAG: hypothetical protein ABI232_09410, partial [Jatrophihabitantaceae bacterium]
VTLAPHLAPSGPARVGGLWQARGSGFAGQSLVRIEVDGQLVRSAYAAANGVIAVPITVPTTLAPGPHTLVLRGTAPDGQPQLVIAPMTFTTDAVTLPAPGPTVSGTPPPTGPTRTTPTSPTRSTSPGSSAQTPTQPNGASSTTGSETGNGGGGSGNGGGTGGNSIGGPGSGGVTSPGATPTSSAGVAASPTPQQTFGGGPQTPAPTIAASPRHASDGIAWLWWLIGALVLLALLAIGGRFWLAGRHAAPPAA